MTRWIYISPHLDDAIYSAGGLIYEQTQSGVPVEIWTIMSKIPEREELSSFAKKMHQLWGVKSARETMHIRREENEKATAIVGAENRYLDFVDSLYRTGNDGQALYNNSFLSLHEDESDLPQRIAEKLFKNLEPNDKLVCPLAFGGHIDHVIVRDAVDLLSFSPFYMGDIPYLLYASRTLWRKTFSMKKKVLAISKVGLKVWLKAIRAYTSQLEVEFGNTEQMEESMTAYWKKNQGIRLWRKR